MKVLIKKDDLYLKFAWITRLKDGSLIGWNLNNEEFIENFPSNIKSFEIHYNYCMKGKHHYSYKYNIDGLKYEIRAYKDHLSTKIYGNISDIQTNELFVPDFKKFNEFFLLENTVEVDLNDPNLVQQISGVGFNIWTDRMIQNVIEFGKKIKPKPTDIVLDIDILGKVSISYSILIYNDPEKISLKSFDNSRHIRISDYDQKPAIELIVSITPN